MKCQSKGGQFNLDSRVLGEDPGGGGGGGRLVATGTSYVVLLWDAELLITRISALSTDYFKGI